MEADSRDDRLEEIRGTIFGACKCLRDYPFPKDADMKRRKKTQKGNSILHKLAADVHVLVSVLENRSFEDTKYIMSLPKSYSVSDPDNTMSNNQLSTCIQDIKLLKNNLSLCQADIISLKQEKDNLRKQLSEGIKEVKFEITKVEKEPEDQYRKSKVRNDISRIEDEKC